MAAIIEARRLTKRFGDVRALDDLDLVAESGQVTALMGPNGAGKTTFVGAVATLLRPDAGEIRVAGIDACAEPERVREVIGLAGQFASVEPAMTGREYVQMVARLFIAIGLTAGNAQAAQGTATLLVIPLAFVSAAYVPSGTLPGWMQPVAANQPFTIITNAVRSLTLGGADTVGLGLAVSRFARRT